MNYINFHYQKSGNLFKITMPFILYIFLNEIFFHIALVITEHRLVAYPWINVFACGSPVGFDPEMFTLFVLFLAGRLAFTYLVRRILVRKYPDVDFTYWIGTYVLMDFLLVLFSLVFPSVLWELYFSSANPILGLKKMWGPPMYLYYLGTGLLCFLCYHFFFKPNPRGYIKIFINDLISFGFVFGLYYLYFNRIILDPAIQ